MGKVLQRAGGGKATVEGLTADVVQAGKTITIKQGSKIIREVTGNYQSPVVATAWGFCGPHGGYHRTSGVSSNTEYLTYSGDSDGWGINFTVRKPCIVFPFHFGGSFTYTGPAVNTYTKCSAGTVLRWRVQVSTYARVGIVILEDA